MKVLIIGSGGREHCLAWKIAQSSLVDKLYCAPGNGGTSLVAQNIDIAANDIDKLLEFAQNESIDLTVIGPEAPLVEGIVDEFESKGLKIFGPKKELAQLEGSKVFAKEVMRKFGIPTAGFEIFEIAGEAKEYINSKGAPLVIKAEGLAAGKGVIVCSSVAQAISAVDLIMVDKKFGDAGKRVIVEDFIEGNELSVIIFTDGRTIIPLASSQDHKRIFDDDRGPNTGGMGAYSPAHLVDKDRFDDIINKVFVPLLEGLRKEGKTYKGILYGGIMLKDDIPYVLEFNVRFGDPETQAILPKLKSDLAEVMLKTVKGGLDGVNLEWDERACICVVLASGGYPDSYEKGKEISGLEKLENLDDVIVFHAGTKLVHSPQSIVHSFVTNGGRVLGVVSLGDTIKQAQGRAYKAIENIKFDKMFYRKDIGDKGAK